MQTIAPSTLYPVFNPPYPQGTIFSNSSTYTVQRSAQRYANSQAGPGRTAKQDQEEISGNHVQAVQVSLLADLCTCLCMNYTVEER